MMHHLDEGTLQALLDGELPDVKADDARKHILRCATCEGELETMRSAMHGFTAAVALLDGSGSRWGTREERAVTVPFSRRDGARVLPRAAAVLVAFAAAAAAAVPGSPVRIWVEARLVGSAPGTALVSEAAPAPVTVAAEPETGIGVAPAAGRFRAVVHGASPSLRIRAVLTEGASGGAYAIGEAQGTRFSGRDGVVEVHDAAGLELRIEFPRAATDASLEIDGRTFVVKDGDQLRLIRGSTDLLGQELVFQLDR